jgi:hypothetical protein
MTSTEFRPGQRVRLLIESHFWKGGAPGTIKSGSVGTFSDLLGGKAQVVFDAEPNYPLVIDNSALEPIPETAPKTFEEFVTQWAASNVVTDMDFGRAAWDAGVASTAQLEKEEAKC